MAQNASKWLTNTEYDLCLWSLWWPNLEPCPSPDGKLTTNRGGVPRNPQICKENCACVAKKHRNVFVEKTTRSISKIPMFFSHSSIVCCLLNSLKRNVSANDGTGSVVSFHPGKIWTKHQCWRHSRDPPIVRANMAATTPGGIWRWWRLQSMIYLLFQGLVFNTNVLFLRSNALMPCLLFHLCHVFFCRDLTPVLPVATWCLEGGSNKIDSVKCSCGYQKILKSELYYLLWIVFYSYINAVASNVNCSCG